MAANGLLDAVRHLALGVPSDTDLVRVHVVHTLPAVLGLLRLGRALLNSTLTLRTLLQTLGDLESSGEGQGLLLRMRTRLVRRHAARGGVAFLVRPLGLTRSVIGVEVRGEVAGGDDGTAGVARGSRSRAAGLQRWYWRLLVLEKVSDL